MKFLRNAILGLSVIAAAASLTSCQNDFDDPSLQVPKATWEANTTISDFKTTFASSYSTLVPKKNEATGEDYVIKGRVISSDASGNIYQSIVIQDETGAMAFSVRGNSMFNVYRLGQEVVVNCTGLYFGQYRYRQQFGSPSDDTYDDLPQLNFMPYEVFKEHVQLNGLPDDEFAFVNYGAAAPADKPYYVVTSLAELPNCADPASSPSVRGIQNQYVELRNVHFELGGKAPYSEYHESISRKLLDDDNHSIDVYNSGYSNFYTDILPEGTGTVRGILSCYGTSWQLLLLSPRDCIFSSEGIESNPYTVDQAIEYQDAGVTGWVKGYIVGSVGSGVSTVTSNADIIWGSDADMDDNLVIGATAETRDITHCLIVQLPQGSDLRKYGNLIDNPTNIGKEILIRGSLNEVMGSYGIRDNKGTASEFKIEGVNVGDGDNPSGSEENPYTVAQVRAGAAGSDQWVKGYIVGWVDGKVYSEGCRFNANATVSSNILLADSPTETNPSACIPVQLPIGDVRTAINLQDNPGNYKKEVSLKGSIEAYFSEPALKSVSAYKMDGSGSSTPVTPTGVQFRKATSITSGAEYILVADGNMALPISSDKTYGYLYVQSVTDNGGLITAPASDAFTLTKSGEGYTMLQADGRYLYMTGTFNSFNTTTTPGDGSVFTISIAADGAATIKNVAMGKTIQFDPNYSSYGAYPDMRGVLPVLYERVK